VKLSKPLLPARRPRALVVRNADILQLANRLLAGPHVKLPVRSYFAPGVYARELMMPAGTVVVGKEHRTEHLNIMLTGKATLIIDGQPVEAVAPFVINSKAGTMKVAAVHEPVRWLTVHPNPGDCRNVCKLEGALTVPFRRKRA